MFKYKAVVTHEPAGASHTSGVYGNQEVTTFSIETLEDVFVSEGHLIVRNTAVFAPGAWKSVFYEEIPAFDRDERIELTRSQIVGIAGETEYTKALAEMSGEETTLFHAAREVIGRIRQETYYFPDDREHIQTLRGVGPE